MRTDRKRILVVDDGTELTRMPKLNLQQTDDEMVRVEDAATGALAAAEQFQPDWILLDVMVPSWDDGELA